RPDPDLPGRGASAVVARAAALRPRRASDAGRLRPVLGADPDRPVGLGAARSEPGGAAAAGLAGRAAHAVGAARLAPGTARTADLLPVLPADPAVVRVVGQRAQPAADAGRHRVGDTRGGAAGAYRPDTPRGRRHGRIRRRAGDDRAGAAHPGDRSGGDDARPAGARAPAGVAADLAGRGPAVVA